MEGAGGGLHTLNFSKCFCVVNSRDFLVKKKALDNPPFQPYYSIPHTMSFQKMHILWTGQFSPKKNLSQGTVVSFREIFASVFKAQKHYRY